MIFSRLQKCVFVVLVCSACAWSATGKASSAEDMFQTMWAQVLDKSLASYRERVAATDLAHLPADKQQAVLDELDALLRPKLSWDRVGNQVISAFYDSCGRDSFERLRVARAEGSIEAPEQTELRAHMESCIPAAMSENLDVVWQVIEKHADEIDEIKRQYGAQSNE